MKYLAAPILLLLAVMLSGCQGQGSGIRGYQQPGYPLRHVVLFAWKPGTPQQTIEDIEQAFAALPGKIPVIKDFEWGRHIGTLERSQGYTHCFLVTFADEAGLEAYLPHPAHKQFVAQMKPHLDKVLVVDYWAREK